MVSGIAQNSRLLLEAFVRPPAEAVESWRRWRENLDVDSLDPRYFRILPMLAPRLGDWLAGDTADSTIRGICKRAWAHNQIAFRSLANAAGALRGAGIAPVVVTGSPAWALLYEESKAIRPLDTLELLVRRHYAARAVDALGGLGWRLVEGMSRPEGRMLDLVEGVWLRNDKDDRLKLSWRLLPSSPESARADETLPKLTATEIFGVKIDRIPPEEMLLHSLGGRRDFFEVDWKWDALALLALRPVDWKRMQSLLGDDSAARLRLRELRTDWQADVPAGILREETPGWLRRRFEIVRGDYRWNAWNAGARPSWVGFGAYCARRWWKVFVTGRRSR